MSDDRDGRTFIDRRMRILAPLRHRDFRMLWTGMTVSLLGDGITTIALAWQAYELSDAPTALSMVMFSMTVPHVILLLVGGAVSDRFDRRRVMIGADSVRLLAVSAMGVLSISGALQIWHMMLIAACYGAGTAFFGPAFDAIVPEIVPERDLTAANSLDQFVRPATFRMLGPAVAGGLIAAFGQPGPAFLADGLTFAISICCLLLMKARTRTARQTGEAGSLFAEIREGFRYVRTQVWLWGTFLAATLAYLIFLGPAEVLMPFVVKEEMGGTAIDLALVFAMGGVGAMLAAVVMSNRGMPRRHVTFMYVAWTASTLMVAGYGIARLPWHVMLFCLAFNALESAGLIVWITTKQVLVPARLLGRVSSFDWFISIGLVPLSFIFTGPAAAAFGPRATLVGAGVLGGVVTLAFLFLPKMRDIERSGVLVGRRVDAAGETGFGAVEGHLAPISAGQGPIPASGTSGAPLRSTLRPTDI
jgi:DHA3 family tetracycline resistance protein-like MFS transporter